MAKEKNADIDLDEAVKKASEAEFKKENVSQATQEIDLNQKIDKIGADLKDIVDKLDSFEVSEDEQEAIMQGANEPAEKEKSALGWVVLGVVVLILGVFAFGKDRILEKIKRQKNTAM